VDTITSEIGFAGAGLYPDCLSLLSFGRDVSSEYLRTYRKPSPVKKVADEVGILFWQCICVVQDGIKFQVGERVYLYTTTLHRPYGSETILASCSPSPTLYVVDITGTVRRYRGFATGKERQVASAEVEKLVRESGQLSLDQMKEKMVEVIRKLQPKRQDRRIDIGWASAKECGKFEVCVIYL